MTVSMDRPLQAARRTSTPLVARRLEVVRVERLSRRLQRVVLGGPALAGLAGLTDLGPADHVKVFFPLAPGREPVLPVVVDGRWVNRGAPGLVHRDYTVRTVTPADADLGTAEQMAIDMVVHDHGPGGRWAAQAGVGQVLGTLGPRGRVRLPLDRDTYVLAADESGLPALLNWMDRLPPTAHVQAFVEVDAPGDEVDVPGDPTAEVTWLYRRGAPAGTTTLLPDAVGAAVAGRAAGSTWVWAASEVTAVRAVRDLLGPSGARPDAAAMTGYWRRGVADFDHHSPDA